MFEYGENCKIIFLIGISYNASQVCPWALSGVDEDVYSVCRYCNHNFPEK